MISAPTIEGSQGSTGSRPALVPNGGSPQVQLGLFAEDKTIRERFEAWKATPGGRHVLRHAYRIAAQFGHRFVARGRRVSMKLIWELLRDRLDWVRAGLKRRGIVLEPEAGFALNNVFTAYVARHIVAHRPEWDGMFELRTTGVSSSKAGVKRRVIVIEEVRADGVRAGKPETRNQKPVSNCRRNLLGKQESRNNL